MSDALTRNAAGRALAAALALAVALLLAAPAPALAKEVERQWTVAFTGKAMVDEGSSSIVQVLAGMQPGDAAAFDVTLEERAEGAAEWYMRNEVLKSMEEALGNAGGSYGYHLTYTAPDGERKVILTNETVSGDAGAGATKGLFDATEATGEWFYLDTLAPGERARVELRVALDGETHGNTYFDTSARLQLAFSAEEVDAPQPPAPQQPPAAQDKPGDGKKTALSQTGDATPLVMVFAAIGATAGVVAAAAAAWACLRRRGEEKGGDA